MAEKDSMPGGSIGSVGHEGQERAERMRRRQGGQAHGAESAASVFLQTRRMLLRALAYDDVFDLQALGRDQRVSASLLDAPVDDIASAVALVEHAQRISTARPGLGLWRASDARGFLGFFSLVAELDPDEVEIGTRLLPRAWGRGYALEGGAALCAHAFDTLGLARLVGMCDPRNRSVPPLLMRLGFMADGQSVQFGNPALRFVLPRERWHGVLRRHRGMSAIAGVPEDVGDRS